MLSSDYILITGADGYIGSRLVRRLLLETECRLHLWLRSDSEPEFCSKREAMMLKLPEAALSTRVTMSYGNLLGDDPFRDIEPNHITKIIHSAAVTRFNVEYDLAQSINVEGNRKLMRFAESCPNLTQYLLVSSIYASGLQPGQIAEKELAGIHGFANHYERSKWQCEADVAKTSLPWSIARLSTVVSDTVAGEVSQFNAVHNTLKLFHYGMLSIVPGSEQSILYFITGDFATAALLSAISANRPKAIFNVCYTKTESIELGKFINIAYSTFMTDEGFKRRRILPPLYSDLESFQSLSNSMVDFGQGIVSQASASISPFAPQLFVQKDVTNEFTRMLLPGYAAPDSVQLVTSLCRWLVQHKWGRAHASVA